MAGRAAITNPARKMSVGWRKAVVKKWPAWASDDKGADLGRTSAEKTLCAQAKKIRDGGRTGRGAGEFREITARLYLSVSKKPWISRTASTTNAALPLGRITRWEAGP
jgi:hypothetical protein